MALLFRCYGRRSASFHTDHVIDAFPGSEELRREYSGEAGSAGRVYG